MSHKYSGCCCQIDPEDESTGIIQMEYVGNGKWKCPKCGGENDCHEIVFMMRLRFMRPNEKNDYRRIEILEPYDQRLNEKQDKHGTTLKDLIEEEFRESQFKEKHKLGVFDVDLLFYPYSMMTDCGTEYDLDIDIIQEKQVFG